MTTYPLATLGPTVTRTGITAPAYADILASLQFSFYGIYGSDAVLTSDSQDGEFLAIMASAINDSNNAVIAAYNSFSPVTAQGVALSSNVKINGLQREVATNSQIVQTVAGTAGTIITNGIVGDDLNLNTQWALPAKVTIPDSGTIDVTAISTTQGSTAAAEGTLTNILTPTRGWQSTTNANAATPGAPVESDATLRQRQSISTALPALSVFDGILAAVANIPGVERYFGYENATGSTDGNGIPAHSICIVVEGGDTIDIAQTILDKKTPGTGTYGGTSEVVFDQYGIASTINFDVLTLTTIYVSITITALANYLSSTAPLIQQAVAAYVSGLQVGEKVYYSRLFSPANLNGTSAVVATGLSQAQLDALSSTFDITALTVGTSPSPGGTSDVAIAFNAAAVLIVANVVITVSP